MVRTTIGMLVGLAAMTVAIGCVNVKVPERINVGTPNGDYGLGGNGGSNDPNKVSKSQAYEIAKDLAEDHDAQLGDYEIHDKSVNDVRYVLFEGRYRYRLEGWKRFFAVRVLPDGGATLLKPADEIAGAEFRGGDDEVLPDLDGDEAKGIAGAIVRKVGLSPADYEVKDKEIRGQRWVLFERLRQSNDLGWKNGFAVHVAKDRTATLTR